MRSHQPIDAIDSGGHITMVHNPSAFCLTRLLVLNQYTCSSIMIWILHLLCCTIPCLLLDGFLLLLFVLCLTPAWFRFLWYYFVASHRTSVRYSRSSCRQTLDMYCLKRPSTSASITRDTANTDPDLQAQDDDNNNNNNTTLLPAPVVVFFTGGAWLIGYKMWGALLARVLTAAGILVVVPDYRNYPWAAAPGMIQDCQDALVWTREHVADYGGDANNIVVVGQSAGGHILLTTLLRRLLELSQAETQEEAASDITHTSWNPRDFKEFISLSAPYNLEAMTTTFMRHGLDRHLVDRIFGREERPKYDPFCILQELQSKTEAGMPLLSNGASLLLPPIRIYHGSKDKTVPQEGSVDFCRKLHEFMEEQQERKEMSFHSYEGWTHTDPILEAPMIADHRFHKDIFDAVVEWTDEDASRSTLIWPADDAILTRRLCPPCLVHAARFCNPF